MLTKTLKAITSAPASLLNSVILSAPAVMAVPVALFSIPILIDSLGLSHLGLLLLSNTVFTFSSLLLFGAEKNLLKIISLNPNRYSRWSACFFALIPAIIFTFIFVLLYYFAQKMIQTDLPFEPLLCFAFVAGALTQCLFSIQKTFFLVVDKYKTVALISFFYNSSVFVIPVVFCIWQEIPPPFEDILVYLLIVRASIILIGALGLPKLATRNINNYTRLSLWQIFDYGKWIGLSQLCQTVLENLDKFFVTYFFGSSALAVYNIAVSVSQKVTVLPVSFSTAIFAKMAKVGEKGTETELLRVLWYLWICLIVFLLGAKQFFTIWLGEHYTQEIGRISVLSFVAYSFFGLNAVFNSLLEIGQKAKKLAFFDSITLVIALTVYFFVNEQFSPLEIATVFLYQQWAAHLVRIKMLSISKTLKFYLRFSAIVFLVIGTALAYN